METFIHHSVVDNEVDDDDLEHLSLCYEGDHPGREEPCCMQTVCGLDARNIPWRVPQPGDKLCPICYEWGEGPV